MVDGEVIQFPSRKITASKGNAGLKTQVPSICATVSSLSEATGGISSRNLVKTDIK